MKATFTRKFCAAHRLLHDDSPCHNIHGHNYTAEIVVSVQHLLNGFVLHADRVKEVVDNKFDHKLIMHVKDPLQENLSYDIAVVAVPYEPTVENLAKWIAEAVSGKVNHDLQGHGFVECTLYEVPTISATARSEW
jgi:6-pyruvoyltetrahydropterin/6-carboxytetrahydropterin synthase